MVDRVWVLQWRLTPAEMKYAVYDRELVGLRDACLHFSTIEIAHIPGKDNIVPDALSRYPQKNGPYEHIVEQEGIVDFDCHPLLSFHSFDARALEVDDFATSTSVSDPSPP